MRDTVMKGFERVGTHDINLEKERLFLEQAMRLAGSEIRRIAAQGFETQYKSNQDPLTTADLAANEILREKLTGAFPSYGWLSEETVDDPHRLTADWVWIVDPIDGTKEFVKGIPEYSISAALVHLGVPVLGAVYNPSTEEYFSAVKGSGASLNGYAIHGTDVLSNRPLILGSRSEMKRGEFKEFEVDFEVRPVGSIAYKLALVSAGKADATFSLGPKNEWDIAAGVLLVKEAGGQAVNKEGGEFLFNRQNTLVSGIIAASEASFSTVKQRIDAQIHDSSQT